jgi:nicotinamide riboside kinase
MEGMATDADADVTICLTGPESTGKTTLAHALAVRFGAPVVPEVARSYLEGRNAYQREDLLEIARRQLDAERDARTAHRGLLLCDTDLWVLRIWWAEKYGRLSEDPPGVLAEEPDDRVPRGYLLLAPDLPWQSDPLRENPTDRDRLYRLHEDALSQARCPHRVVTGLGQARVDCAIRQLQSLSDELRAG